MIIRNPFATDFKLLPMLFFIFDGAWVMQNDKANTHCMPFSNLQDPMPKPKAFK